jgi:hypothetical protein
MVLNFGFDSSVQAAKKVYLFDEQAVKGTVFFGRLT